MTSEYNVTQNGTNRKKSWIPCCCVFSIYSCRHDIQYVHPGKIYVSDPGNNRIQILNESLDVIEMFTSYESSWMTGNIINVDGGENITS